MKHDMFSESILYKTCKTGNPCIMICKQVNEKGPFHCVVMCSFQNKGLLGVSSLQVDGRGQSESEWERERERDRETQSPAGHVVVWYARRALRAVPVPRPVCSQANTLHTCGPSAYSCLLWHLRCCLLQQHIFHPRHPPRHHLPPLSRDVKSGTSSLKEFYFLL